MLRTAPRRGLLAAGALTAVLALSACTGDGTSVDDAAPEPAPALPSAVASVVLGTDVGQFFVNPNDEVSKETIDGAIAKLKTLPGVQSAELTDEGLVDVQFRGGITVEQREAAVRQMAALGEVTEGV